MGCHKISTTMHSGSSIEALTWYSRSLNRNWAARAPQHTAVNIGSAAFSLRRHSSRLTHCYNNVALVAAAAPCRTAAAEPRCCKWCTGVTAAACCTAHNMGTR
jgi:hypothetical protein